MLAMVGGLFRIGDWLLEVRTGERLLLLLLLLVVVEVKVAGRPLETIAGWVASRTVAFFWFAFFFDGGAAGGIMSCESPARFRFFILPVFFPSSSAVSSFALALAVVEGVVVVVVVTAAAVVVEVEVELELEVEVEVEVEGVVSGSMSGGVPEALGVGDFVSTCSTGDGIKLG